MAPMDAVELRLPRTSETVDESVIVFWYRGEGDRVRAGEVLVEVQTEKATYEVEAPVDGVVSGIRVKRGEVARVGDVLCTLLPVEAADAGAGAAPGAEAEQSGAGVAGAGVAGGAAGREGGVASGAASGQRDGFVAMAPRLRRLAQELGVDPASLHGTGPGGRITEEDIRRAAATKAGAGDLSAALPGGGHAAPGGALPQGDVMDSIRAMTRRTIARRMVQSLQESAQLTLTAWADVTALHQRRAALAPGASWTAWVARAAVLALHRHPEMNAVWQDERVVPQPAIHLGIAVDTPDGLWVPVIREATALGVAALQERIDTLAEAARRHALSPEEQSGGTFTVTNLGGFGVVFFTPILQPPQAGILGIGALESYPSWDGTAFRPGWRLPLSLTFDHRILDGAPAARFLATVCSLLREPESLV